MLEIIGLIIVILALALFIGARKRNKVFNPVDEVRQARRERMQRVKKNQQPKVEPSLEENSIIPENDLLNDAVHFAKFDQQVNQYIQSKQPVPEIVDIPEIINIYIVAKKDKAFIGHELLQSLLTAGLRFGEMNIFHRHEEAKGTGPILFSLAASHEPGSFDLSNMGNFSCQGLSLFMQLSMVENGIETFNLMLATARQLAQSLNGELRAGRELILTDSLIEQFRQQARAYEEQHAVTQ